MKRHPLPLVAVLVFLFASVAPEVRPPGARAAEAHETILLAAGDVAECSDLTGAEKTAKLLDRFPDGTIALLGDGAYPNGSLEEYEQCYGPTWGRHRDRTRPAIGNHDYDTKDGAGYFEYFGSQAGDPKKGYYRYRLGNWDFFVLNSNCGQVGGCGRNSPQAEWLREELAKSKAPCIGSYWHHARFFSAAGGRGSRVWDSSSDTKMSSMWRSLQDAGADLVLAGHYHVYERLAPVRIEDGGKVVESPEGIRSFVVGTGGGDLEEFQGKPDPHSEFRLDGHWGILKVNLGADGYDWEFLDTAGTVRDSGSQPCRSGDGS